MWTNREDVDQNADGEAEEDLSTYIGKDTIYLYMKCR